MLGLKSSTVPAWAQTALCDTTALLRDHAHLERKAAGQMITLMGQIPDAGDRLLATAREELEHFELVHALLARRGVGLGHDHGNPYVARLAKRAGNSLLERILRMGLIEARSYERFCLLAAGTGDAELHALFDGLKESEAGHHALFIKLAHEGWPYRKVRTCWDDLALLEAEVSATTPWGTRVH